MHFAALNGHLAMAQLLLQRGADPYHEDKWGETAFDIARDGRHSEVEALLAESMAAFKRAAEAAEELRRRATALGLLEALTDVNVADDAMLKKAIAWCDEQGVTSVSDMVEYDMVDDFVFQLRLKTLPSRKLRKALLDLVKQSGELPGTASKAGDEAFPSSSSSMPSPEKADGARNFDVFISHSTTDDSHSVFQVVSAFLHAKGKVVFNPTTHLSHVPKINAAAMADAVKRSRLVVAALSEGFFGSKWCEAEIAAAKEAGIKVVPVFSGDDHGSNQIDKWIARYRDHAAFGYIFRENARDVLNKQNDAQVSRTLESLSRLC